MLTRYFRYLFENRNNGLFHSGCIYDRAKDKVTNYIYMVGSYCRSTLEKKAAKNEIKEDTIPHQIDLLVVGGYTAAYLKKLIYVVEHHKIETIILPYLAPMQRLILVQELEDYEDGGRKAVRFLQDPYLFLQQAGIENIYFLYKNGRMLEREPEELEEGCHFEMADRESLRLIQEMEGYAIPVVKAGYIVENGWLFYFGVYGIALQTLSAFTRDYFSQMENIHEISENIHEDYVSQMKHLIQEYTKKFGTSPETTVTMFEGPIHASTAENDSFMSEKEFSQQERCEAWMQRQGEEHYSCAIKCMYCKDYDTMQHHKDKQQGEGRFGMLMLGNLNLNCYLLEMISRFDKVSGRIRGIGVPNCGNWREWNRHIIDVSSEKDRMYWICGRNEKTSASVVTDIVLSSQNNRFLAVDEKMGVCFSGYLIPKTEEEL